MEKYLFPVFGFFYWHRSMSISSFAAGHFAYSLSGQVDVLKDNVEPRLLKSISLFCGFNQIFRGTVILKKGIVWNS